MEVNDTLLNFFKKFNVSTRNQEIFSDYIDDYFKDIGKGLSEVTIQNNVRMMMFIVKNVSTDLDKLTRADIKRYKRSLENHKRKDGKSLSKSTTKYYLVGFKQFLRWASKEFDKPEYRDLIDDISTRIKVPGKNASDMLTDEEIDRMFVAATEPRDIALLSVLIESGCRAGELVSMKIKHVKFTEEFVWVTFPRSKTKVRTLPLKESMTYLANWLEKHPLKNDEDASLWVSLDPLPTKKGETDRAYQTMKTDSVLQLIHRLAVRAGIKKRCYTHLLRHGAATERSKMWTEPTMRSYFGWSANSAMPSVYSHLGGNAIADAVRDWHGTAEERKPEPKLQKCPRCKRELPKRAEYCDVCGTKLADQQIQKVDEFVANAMRQIIEENPEILQNIFMTMMKQQQQS